MTVKHALRWLLIFTLWGALPGRAEVLIRIDAVELQRRRLEVRTGERLHVTCVGLGELPMSVVVDLQQHGGDFQERVGLRVEAAGLDIHHDGEEATKARPHGQFDRRGAHASTSFHCSRSPAAWGTSSCSPRRSMAGTSQLCFSRVTSEVFAGRP